MLPRLHGICSFTEYTLSSAQCGAKYVLLASHATIWCAIAGICYLLCVIQSVLVLLHKLHKRRYGVVLQGYVVFSVEHADGTASAAQLAYGAGWLYYKGWGSEEERMAQTRLVGSTVIH